MSLHNGLVSWMSTLDTTWQIKGRQGESRSRRSLPTCAVCTYRYWHSLRSAAAAALRVGCLTSCRRLRFWKCSPWPPYGAYGGGRWSARYAGGGACREASCPVMGCWHTTLVLPGGGRFLLRLCPTGKFTSCTLLLTLVRRRAVVFEHRLPSERSNRPDITTAIMIPARAAVEICAISFSCPRSRAGAGSLVGRSDGMEVAGELVCTGVSSVHRRPRAAQAASLAVELETCSADEGASQ